MLPRIYAVNPVSATPNATPASHLLAGLRAFRAGRRTRTLSDHLRNADSPADLNRYLTECQLRADEWERKRAEDIAAMDRDTAWQQNQEVRA